MNRLASVVPALLAACLLLSAPARAQDAEVEISEAALNQFLARLGHPSDGGVYRAMTLGGAPGIEICEPIGYLECPIDDRPGLQGIQIGQQRPQLGARVELARCRMVGGGQFIVPIGPPVTFQWWITDARLAVSSGAMTLTATVRSHVGTRWNDPVRRTVPASVSFDASSNRLLLRISDFKVPIQGEFEGTTHQVTEVDVAQLLAIAIPIEPQRIQVPLPDGTTRTLTGRAVSASPFYDAGKLRLHVNVRFQ
jgi:hypothetical protein